MEYTDENSPGTLFVLQKNVNDTVKGTRQSRTKKLKFSTSIFEKLEKNLFLVLECITFFFYFDGLSKGGCTMDGCVYIK